MAGVVQRPGVEPAQLVATVSRPLPLPMGCLCMGWNLVDPLGSGQFESLNCCAERDGVRTPSCSLSVIQSRWVRRDRGPGTSLRPRHRYAGHPGGRGHRKRARSRASAGGAPALIADRMPWRACCDRPAAPWSAIHASARVCTLAGSSAGLDTSDWSVGDPMATRRCVVRSTDPSGTTTPSGPHNCVWRRL